MEKEFTKNEKKVLKTFLERPTVLFSAREIARLIKITHPTVSTALKKLKKQDLVIQVSQKNKSRIGNTTLWQANIENQDYKATKRIENLKALYSSGLINAISQSTSPNAIILFGSYSRGEDIEDSDIDLFVQSKEYNLNLKKFERKLHRKINLTFSSELKSLSKEFFTNIINGIVIHGYLEVSE